MSLSLSLSLSMSLSLSITLKRWSGNILAGILKSTLEVFEIALT